MGWDPPPPLDKSYSVKGRALTGGSFPADAWQQFMRAALDGVPVTDFSEPAPIRDVASEEIQRERRGFAPRRSAEHTSELQSLMRISYAVFCLKKKTTRHHINKKQTKDQTSLQ